MDENINNEKNAKKKKLIDQIVLTSIFGLIIIGTSLAIFFARASGGLNNITTKDLVDVTYTEGSTLRLTSNTPIFEDEIESKATEFNFTVNNPNSTAVYASIDLTDISMSSSLKDYDFKWGLYEGDTKLTTGSFVDAGTTLNLYNNSVINGNSSKTYKIRIWLNETGETQNFQGTSFTSKVEVTAYSRELRTLNSKILSDNTVNTNAPTFTKTSTDKGLFVQKEDNKKSEFGFPTYYYRGAVENNYVQFGTYKSDVINTIIDVEIPTAVDTKVASSGDPILWRIIRINEDGSIRLINENNVGTDTIWNSSGYSKYINDDGTDSDIKNTIETWYESNITENNLKNMVQTNAFCSDIVGIDFSDSSQNTYNIESFKRINNNEPIFKCLNGSIIAESKAGMITVDEVIYAGSIWGYNNAMTNNITYLNNQSIFTTITPSISNSIYTVYIDPVGHFIDSSSQASARPVINLKSNVLIKSGDGTINNPYIISDANL